MPHWMAVMLFLSSEKDRSMISYTSYHQQFRQLKQWGSTRKGGNCWEILMQLLSDNSNSHILVYLCTNSVLLQLKLLHTITSDSKPIAHLPICMFAHLHTTTFAHTLAHQHRTIWSPVGLIQLQQETRSGRVFTLKSTEKRSPALLTATMTLLMMIWLSVNEWP